MSLRLSITSNHAIHNQVNVTGIIQYRNLRYIKMFYQIGVLPVTTNLLDNSSDIYLTVYGIIRSDRLIIQGSCVDMIEKEVQVILRMLKTF